MTGTYLLHIFVCDFYQVYFLIGMILIFLTTLLFSQVLLLYFFINYFQAYLFFPCRVIFRNGRSQSAFD